jgi:hypothetical protein
MNTKLLIVGAVLVLAAAGYFAFMRTASDDPGSGAPQGKLDINAICDGALAYMTFPDGDAAAAFVAECKEGKRPEVIERYKQDMGLGDDAAI